MFESECHALLVGSILPCGLSPLYHEYRGSTLNRPEVFLLTRDRIMKFVDDSRPTRMSGGYKRGFMNLAKNALATSMQRLTKENVSLRRLALIEVAFNGHRLSTSVVQYQYQGSHKKKTYEKFSTSSS